MALLLPGSVWSINILLQEIINIYLNTSYCITVITQDYIVDIKLPQSYIFIYEKSFDQLTHHMLNASEMGCSDYIVQMYEPEIFLNAFEKVVHMGTVRRSDRKIIMFLPQSYYTNKEKILSILSMKEANFVPNLLLILPSDTLKECKTYDLITHKFVGLEEHNTPIYLDIWNSCTAKFEKAANLFPHDMSNLYGKTVKVAGFTYKPYILLDLDPNIVPEGRDGMDVRIVTQFCRWINCTVKLIRNDEHQWGEIYENLTGVGVLGNVIEDRADLGITALYSWYEEYVVMDFSAPYIRTGVTCIAPSPRLLPSWQLPFLPFSLYMWVALIFTFILASLALYIVKGFKTDDVFLITFGIMITQADSGFHTWRIRSVVGWMMIAGLVLDNAYGGGLASTFTIPKYELSVDTIQDIVDRKLIWGATHDAWTFSLILSQEPRIKDLVSLYHTYSAEELNRKSLMKSIAFGIEKLPAGTFAIGEYITKEASLDYTIMLEEFYFEQCIMMMRKSSPFTNKLSDLIGRLHESGLLLAWETQIALQYLDYKVQLAVKLSRSKKDIEKIEPLALSHVEGIFIIYTIGVIISILVLLIEILVYKRK